MSGLQQRVHTNWYARRIAVPGCLAVALTRRIVFHNICQREELRGNKRRMITVTGDLG